MFRARRFANEYQRLRNALFQLRRSGRVQIAGEEGQRNELQRRTNGDDAVMEFQLVNRDAGQCRQAEATLGQFDQR